MTIEERAIGSVVVLDMSGRLVLGEGDQLLKDRVASHLQKGHRHVLLNVSKLSYVDSSGSESSSHHFSPPETLAVRSGWSTRHRGCTSCWPRRSC